MYVFCIVGPGYKLEWEGPLAAWYKLQGVFDHALGCIKGTCKRVGGTVLPHICVAVGKLCCMF